MVIASDNKVCAGLHSIGQEHFIFGIFGNGTLHICVAWDDNGVFFKKLDKLFNITAGDDILLADARRFKGKSSDLKNVLASL
jgi:hypothetical protein